MGLGRIELAMSGLWFLLFLFMAVPFPGVSALFFAEQGLAFPHKST